MKIDVSSFILILHTLRETCDIQLLWSVSPVQTSASLSTSFVCKLVAIPTMYRKW